MGTSLSSFNFFIGRCVPNLGALGFIFNEWERENELVFYMCLFRTVTWNASRRGGEGSDRQTLFQVACAGPGSQECYPHGTLWNLGRELGSRPPPQRGGFWGQWAGLRFQVDISAQTKGLWYEGLKREGQKMWKAVHRMRLFC